MKDLHRKHGDKVRVGSNAFSFATPESYVTIYGHPKKGQKKFIKAAVYDKGERRIANVRDPAEHAQQRKLISNAFSSRVLRDQEVAVHRYLDLLVQQLNKLGIWRPRVSLLKVNVTHKAIIQHSI